VQPPAVIVQSEPEAPVSAPEEVAMKINGTAGQDTLDGTRWDDEINGFGGNDLIIGDEGADSINGGSGTDSVSYFAYLTGLLPKATF
jgi:RTX calcium-binding nonapeptide repeat (4 copies)